jgi:hypothetical protein
MFPERERAVSISMLGIRLKAHARKRSHHVLVLTRRRAGGRPAVCVRCHGEGGGVLFRPPVRCGCY